MQDLTIACFVVILATVATLSPVTSMALEEFRSEAHPMDVRHISNEIAEQNNIMARKGRFWAPWTSVSTMGRGRFNVGFPSNPSSKKSSGHKPSKKPNTDSTGYSSGANCDSCPMFLRGRRSLPPKEDGLDTREGRFWAPWSSVSAASRGRFHSGSVAY